MLSHFYLIDEHTDKALKAERAQTPYKIDLLGSEPLLDGPAPLLPTYKVYSNNTTFLNPEPDLLHPSPPSMLSEDDLEIFFAQSSRLVSVDSLRTAPAPAPLSMLNQVADEVGCQSILDMLSDIKFDEEQGMF